MRLPTPLRLAHFAQRCGVRRARGRVLPPVLPPRHVRKSVQRRAPRPAALAAFGPTWWKLAAFGEFREHALSVSLAPRPEPRQHVTSLSPAAMANAPWIGAL